MTCPHSSVATPSTWLRSRSPTGPSHSIFARSSAGKTTHLFNGLVPLFTLGFVYSKEGGTLRKMSTEKLLKTLPTLHDQLDALLEFEATAADLNNGVINAAFMLLFRDLIRLFACYNDGIINLLEKFFEMNKKNARDALDIYKRFLIRMDRVGEFLKVAEVSVNKHIMKAPSSMPFLLL